MVVRLLKMGWALSAIVAGYLISWTSARADNLDEWDLQSSYPYLNKVACGPDRLVAVGANTILYSTNAADWISADGVGDSQTTFGDVAYGNGVFVVVGYQFVPQSANGIILTSTNGAAWSRFTFPSNGIYGVSFLDGQFFAVGRKGLMLSSTEGFSWQSITTGTSNNLFGVGFGDGLFVAVGDFRIITSTNGLNWSDRSPIGAGWLKSVAYGQRKFIAVSRTRPNMWLSTDGLNWIPNAQESSNPAFGAELESIVHSNGLFLCMGGGVLATSPDGSNWILRATINAGGPSSWSGATFWEETVVVVGNGIIQSQPFSGAKRSPRLVTNPQSQIVLRDRAVSFSVMGDSRPPLNFQWQKNGHSIFGQTNLSLAVVATLTNAGDYRVVATNSFGSVTSSVANLSIVGTIKPLPPSMLPATLGGEMTLQVETSGNANLAYQWRSNKQGIPNAMNPTVTLSNIQAVHAGAYDVIVTNIAGAVTNSPFFLTIEPYRDHPLYHWSPAESHLGSFGGLSSVEYGNGTFVAVGSISGTDIGVILSSKNGKDWIRRDPFIGGPFVVFNLYDLAFGNGSFVAVGYSRAIYSSTNGVDWFLRSSGPYGTYYDRVVFHENAFWAGQTGGPTLRSTDGITWQSSAFWPTWVELPVSGLGILATLSNSPNALFISMDFETWSMAYANDAGLSDLAYGNGIFVAVGGKGLIVHSDPIVQIAWDSSQARHLAVRGLVGRFYQIDRRDSLGPTGSWAPFTAFILSNNPVLVPINSTLPESRGFFRAVYP